MFLGDSDSIMENGKVIIKAENGVELVFRKPTEKLNLSKELGGLKEDNY